MATGGTGLPTAPPSPGPYRAALELGNAHRYERAVGAHAHGGPLPQLQAAAGELVHPAPRSAWWPTRAGSAVSDPDRARELVRRGGPLAPELGPRPPGGGGSVDEVAGDTACSARGGSVRSGRAPGRAGGGDARARPGAGEQGDQHHVAQHQRTIGPSSIATRSQYRCGK